jgi:hypothetical protein
MFRKRWVPLLATALLLGAASSARADLEIALAEDGGPAFTVVAKGASFTSASFTGTFGDFTVTIFGAASDNGAALSDLLSADVKVTNNSGAAHTLHFFATQDGYSLPAGSPLMVEAGLAGTLNTGLMTLTDVFQAWADANNGLFAIPGTFTTGKQDATMNGSTFDTGSATGLFNRTGNYSVTSEVNYELSGGGSANFSTHVNLTPAVPAPAGILLAIAGLPCLGVGTWLRRRAKSV